MQSSSSQTENFLPYSEHKFELLMLFNKIKSEFRNEKLLIYIMLNYYLFRLEVNLENISII